MSSSERQAAKQAYEKAVAEVLQLVSARTDTYESIVFKREIDGYIIRILFRPPTIVAIGDAVMTQCDMSAETQATEIGIVGYNKLAEFLQSTGNKWYNERARSCLDVASCAMGFTLSVAVSPADAERHAETCKVVTTLSGGSQDKRDDQAGTAEQCEQ